MRKAQKGTSQTTFTGGFTIGKLNDLCTVHPASNYPKILSVVSFSIQPKIELNII